MFKWPGTHENVQIEALGKWCTLTFHLWMMEDWRINPGSQVNFAVYGISPVQCMRTLNGSIWRNTLSLASSCSCHHYTQSNFPLTDGRFIVLFSTDLSKGSIRENAFFSKAWNPNVAEQNRHLCFKKKKKKKKGSVLETWTLVGWGWRSQLGSLLCLSVYMVRGWKFSAPKSAQINSKWSL